MDYKNKNWLEKKYCIEKFSGCEISKICNVSHRTIYVWLKKHNLKTRTLSEMKKNKTNKNLLSKAWLYNQYIVENKTIKEIEKITNCSSVQYWLKKHGITTRKSYEHFKPKYGKDNPMYGKIETSNPFYGKTHSKKTKELISQKNQGKNLGPKNPSWNGGSTKINEKIRKSTVYSNWRKEVFSKDEYTCVDCGYNKGNIIEADHIKPFSLIIKENKIKTLIEAYNCQELWDINNGRTLCKRCHKKTNTYGEKSKKMLRKAICK